MRRFVFLTALAALLVLLLPSMVLSQRDFHSGDKSPGDKTPGGKSPGWGDPRKPDPGGVTTLPGDPLPGLTAAQQATFNDGLEDFEEVEGAPSGLGPVFNGKSCAECHAQAAVGGAGPDLGVSREIRFGTQRNGVFDPLAQLGGSLIQARGIHEELPDSPITGEIVPSEATFVSQRITTPIFGAGLIEAIPAAQILQRADPNDRDRDGITGVPNRVFNPETGQTEVGRFGWKAHASTLHRFAGDAYLNEMGITNPFFPDENLPQGQPIPAGSDLVPGLEDDGEGVELLAGFMRFLAPVAPGRQTTQTQQGSRVFQGIGCAGCHTPSMTTGDNPVAALRLKRVDLYSDLLLHDMGPDLTDGIEQGTAKGSEWRTAPLWGLSKRQFYLHDGRAATVEAAITAHSGEAGRARARFSALTRSDREALLAFLSSL